MVAFLRCQENWWMGWQWLLFCFYFGGRGFAWSIFAGLSAIKTCRSHDLVSPVLFCTLSPSTYPHIIIWEEWGWDLLRRYCILWWVVPNAWCSPSRPISVNYRWDLGCLLLIWQKVECVFLSFSFICFS